MSSHSSRIKIRCPNCQNDGRARPELLNHRVACKHCSHIFRAIPVDDDHATSPPPAGMSVSSASAIVPGFLPGDPPQTLIDPPSKDAGQVKVPRPAIDDELEQTIEIDDDEPRTGPLHEELRFLRDQLDKARLEGEAETRKRREAAATLSARTAEHAKVVQELRQELEAAQAETRSKVEAEARSAVEFSSLRDELRRNLGELDQARKALETLGRERDQAVAEQSRAIDTLRAQLSPLEARLVDAEASRTHRDQLAREVESLQKRFADAERIAAEQKESLEASRLAEVESLRDQLGKALASSADAAILRQELDEVRAERDQLTGEIETLRAKRLEAEARRLANDWNSPSTEMDIPLIDPDGIEPPAEEATVFDDGSAKSRDEAETLRAELAALAEQLAEKESDLAELGELTERAKAEAKDLRRDLYDARLAAEHATKAARELADRVRQLEAAPLTVVAEQAPAAIDPAVIEAERKQAVEEALKNAWADFERRLADTQTRLKAANTRADLMEADAREAREQIAARERSLELLGDGSSMGGEIASLTSLRILDARGTARITPADAEARLALARQLAVERKDKGLIDRIGKMAEKVKADLEARNYTLAETLVRGAEIEAGLDPGGFSINGLGIFRSSPTIVGSLAALAPAFDRVMRQGEIDAIRSTIEEMKTILGDQVGLPEIRRPGRIPEVRRSLAQPEAFRLFLDALVAESWLVKPVIQKKPLPDTTLGTYASLIEGACVARKLAPALDPEQVAFLDEIIQACCLMLTRRQQADGHFPFLDPRGKASKASTVVEGMVAQRSDAVKDGWVIHVDPIGLAQIETGACASALTAAGATLERMDWVVAAEKAAEWAVGQPCLPNFVANAVSAGLVARSYINTGEDPQLVGLVRKLSMGLLPGQSANGRWVDPLSATTANHLLILRALHDAWEAIPEDRKQFRKDLKASLNLALGSLLEECKVLGVPPQGGALRDLLRHRDLFKADADQDPRLEAAILDSATVIQDLCHDGAKPRLGVAADQLAALMEITADVPALLDS